MTFEEADRAVRAALEQLEREQPALFSLQVSERALTHHLANCVASRVDTGLNVDVEYNRQHDDPKRLNLPPRKALDHEIRATTVFPDVIVHVRDTDSSNLIVLEVKRSGEPKDYDALKLRAFELELGYLHAAHVIVGVNDEDEPYSDLEWLDG